MKKILTLLLLIFLALPGRSQVLLALLFGDKLQSERVSFGLNLGMNSTTLTNISEADWQHKFMLGMYFDIKLKNNDAWSIHPGVDIKNTFGARHINPYLIGIPELDTLLASSTISRQLKLIYVPVTMRYTTKAGFGFEGGFQIGVLTRADDFFNQSDLNTKKDELIYSVKNSKSYHRFDFAWRGGVFYKIQKGKGVFINVNFQYGMVDMPKVNAGSPIRNMGIQWNVSIPVGVKDKKAETEGPSPEEGSIYFQDDMNLTSSAPEK